MESAIVRLTGQQAKVERFIREYQDVHGYAPSVRDIASWFGWSPNGALCHLRALERKGRIRRDAGVARSWRLLDKSED